MRKCCENDVDMEYLVRREPFIEESVLAVHKPPFGDAICIDYCPDDIHCSASHDPSKAHVLEELFPSEDEHGMGDRQHSE